LMPSAGSHPRSGFRWTILRQPGIVRQSSVYSGNRGLEKSTFEGRQKGESPSINRP
jgi:hypothetical protein